MAGYEKNTLYHYTDFQALDGILRHAQLRVNNVLNMNDAAEMRLFMSGLCHAVVKRLEAEEDWERAGKVRKLFQEELKKELNEEQWKLFETCSCKMSGYTSSESCRMFQHGFRLAVKLIVAGLGVPGES